MQALRNSVNDVNNVKTGSNYINEDNGPKEAYNQAVTHAQTLINAQSNPEMSRDVVNQNTSSRYCSSEFKRTTKVRTSTN